MPDPAVETTEETILLEVLASLHPTAKRNSLRRMVDHGRVRVDGDKATRANMKVLKGSLVEVLSKADGDKPLTQPKETIPEPEVLYYDAEIILANKPAGLLSVATDRGELDTMFDRVAKWAWENGETRTHLVHRLDRETSGIMIFALSKQNKEYLQEQFAERSIYRTYFALVEGKLPRKHGTEIEWLLEDKNLRVKKVKPNTKSSKEAITHWEVVKENQSTSLVRIAIDTGRRHQIRMAMKSLGSPVVGDDLHGAKTDPMGRVCLHASSLEFLHPQTDEPVRFETRVPFN